jgi:O-antigen/teichoic acid export membrane protein
MSDSSNGTRRTVAHGLAWMYFSAAIGGLSKLVVLAILARLLTPRDFGLVAIALILTSLVERLGQVGVGPALIQRPSIDADDVVTGAVLSALFGLLMAVLVWVVAPLVADFFQEPLVAPLVRVLSIGFFIDGLGVTSDALIQRSLKFRTMMVVENLSYVVGIGLVGSVLAMLGLGVWALVAAQVAMRMFRTGLLYWMAPTVGGVGHFNRGRVGELLYLGGGFSLGRILNFASLQGDNFVVGRLLGMESLGFYSRAYQLMALPALYVAQVLERVLFPVLAKEQSHTERLRRVYLSVLELLTLVSLPVGALFFFAGAPIVEVVFGDRWGEVVPVLSVLSFGVFFRTAYKCSDTVARSLGAVYQYAFQQGAYAVGVVIGSVVGASLWGTLGVAAGVVAAVAANYALMTRLSAKLLSLSLSDLWRAHLSGMLVSACVTVSLWRVSVATADARLSAFQQVLVLSSTAVCVWGMSCLIVAHIVPGKALEALLAHVATLRWGQVKGTNARAT